MGEMALYYAVADVALLGGSFEPLGGQNLIEAAACGCPVVMGPHTFNFSEAAELSLDAGAALRVADMDEGVARAVALANDPRSATNGCSVPSALPPRTAAPPSAWRGDPACRVATAAGSALDRTGAKRPTWPAGC